jgi:hypothetical protein
LKRAIETIIVAVILGLLLSCGSGGGSGTSSTSSGISKRAFVSNAYMGLLDIIDYTKQTESSTSYVSVGSQPGLMAVTPDRTLTIVVDQATNGLSLVDNKSETAMSGATMPAAISSIVVSPDSKTAWIATRNAPVDGAQSGAVQVVDLNTATLGTLETQIPVPLAKTLALSPDGTKMLVFGDQTDQVTLVSTTANTPATTPPTFPTPVVVGGAAMSRPVAAVFTSDGTKAYVANCGAECGGTGPAGVSVVDMTANPPSASAEFTVAGIGASAILFDGTTVYVAGQGTVTALTPNGTTFTVAKGPTAIGAGLHNNMVLGADNKIFIGATGCPDGANVANAGCLTIYDKGAGLSTITTGGAGTVTGMAVVPNSHLVYVVMGGELVTYDTTTSAVFKGPCGSPTGQCFVDIVGQAVDVKIIDQ